MNKPDADTAAAEIVLEARQVSKTYRTGPVEVLAVREVSLKIRAGETWCVMGASGAGKSTLLNMLGGLDQPTGGEVFYRGQNLYRLPPRRHNHIRGFKLGFVFQSYHLLDELSVLENVLLPAMASPGYLAQADALRERALDLLNQVGLGNRSRHRPLELSGGEQQRTALARALMNEPELVLADEPTGNLDSATGAQILDYLFNLTLARGHTLVMVTHNQSISGRFSHTLVLRDGHLASGGESGTVA